MNKKRDRLKYFLVGLFFYQDGEVPIVQIADSP